MPVEREALKGLFQKKLDAARDLQAANRALVADLPDDGIRVVLTDDGTLVLPRTAGRLVERTDADLLDLRTATEADAP